MQDPKNQENQHTIRRLKVAGGQFTDGINFHSNWFEEFNLKKVETNQINVWDRWSSWQAKLNNIS